EPGLGPGAKRFTSSDGRGTGSDSSSIWLKHEKIAAFAPIPRASDTIATPVTNGVLKRVRNACRMPVAIRLLDGDRRPEVYRLCGIMTARLNGRERCEKLSGRSRRSH